MELKVKQKYKGSRVFIKRFNREVEVNEENAPTLLMFGFDHFFIFPKPERKQPLKEAPKKKTTSKKATKKKTESDNSSTANNE